MNYIDLVLLGVIFGFTLFGFWFGVLHTLGSAVGTVLGVFLASRWYASLAGWLVTQFGWNQNFSNVLVFFVLFLIINRLVGFLFYIVDSTFGILARLPFLNSLNHLLGAVLGFFESIIVLGITLYFISRFPLSPEMMAQISVSRVAPLCAAVAAFLWPLVPGAIRTLQNYLQTIIH